jgi:hypothetical protein
MVPDKKFAVIILANKSGQSMEKSADKAMELMLPLAPKTNEADAKGLTIDPAEMAELAGTFAQTSSPAGLRLRFAVQDGKLVVTIGGPNTDVKKTGPNRFTVNLPGISEPVSLAVIRNPEGKIAYIHVGGRALKRLEPTN